MHMDDDLQNDLKQVMGEHGNSRLSRAGAGAKTKTISIGLADHTLARIWLSSTSMPKLTYNINFSSNSGERVSPSPSYYTYGACCRCWPLLFCVSYFRMPPVPSMTQNRKRL